MDAPPDPGLLLTAAKAPGGARNLQPVWEQQTPLQNPPVSCVGRAGQRWGVRLNRTPAPRPGLLPSGQAQDLPSGDEQNSARSSPDGAATGVGTHGTLCVGLDFPLPPLQLRTSTRCANNPRYAKIVGQRPGFAQVLSSSTFQWNFFFQTMVFQKIMLKTRLVFCGFDPTHPSLLQELLFSSMSASSYLLAAW